MDHSFLVAALMGVSLLYATAGQAGGTAFVAVMAFAAFPAAEMRPTALLLNVVAASYATWSLHQNAAIDRKTLLLVTIPSMVAAFGGGLLVLGGQVYFALTGLLLVIAAALMIVRRGVDSIEAQSVKAFPAALAGAASGFLSGLTGVGGGVFLTPLIIAFGWASPKRAAALSPPFILCNSAVGLVGVLIARHDPKKTEADMKAGKPVTGAAATTAMQVEGLAADAVQKGATAGAMAESEEELLAKQKRGVKLSSTEALRLGEIKTRRAESRVKEVEATLNEAWQPLGLKFALEWKAARTATCSTCSDCSAIATNSPRKGPRSGAALPCSKRGKAS